MAQAELYLKIQSDMLRAAKERNVSSLKILRFLKSQLDSAAKDKRSDLTEEEVVRVIQKKIKQSQDALEKYQQGSRDDLAGGEQQEIDLVSAYLPAQLPAAEIEAIAAKVVAGLGTVTSKDFGRVMGQVMKAAGPRADGKMVKAIVEKAVGAL